MQVKITAYSPLPARLSYVLVTPARNEAPFLVKTIQSVVEQSIRPLRWVIVSDGSTDGTDELVRKYSEQFEWLELIRMPERQDRNFAGKALSFNAGWKHLQSVPYDLIGNLDADVSFEPDFFSFLIEKFTENPRLGVGGAGFTERGVPKYDYRFASLNHVSGPCQVFRRNCLEAIGGYVPVKNGGIDVIAVTTARMKGWQTRTFTEKHLEHRRKMGSATNGNLKAKFLMGRKDYDLGGHLIWEISRVAFQMRNRPFIIGGACLLAGYLSSSIRQARRPVSDEFVQFRRREQIQRLKRILLFCYRSGSEE